MHKCEHKGLISTVAQYCFKFKISACAHNFYAHMISSHIKITAQWKSTLFTHKGPTRKLVKS